MSQATRELAGVARRQQATPPPILACSRCHGPLEDQDSLLACRQCQARFLRQEGVVDFAPHRPARECTFPIERLRALSRVEETHFWFAGRRDLLCHAMSVHVPPGSRVLDVGCGSGRFLLEWARLGYTAAGVDLLTEGLVAATHALPGTVVARADGTALPFGEGSFDAVTCLDLLEHVDDVRTLVEVRRVLRPGGVIVASVPAHPWLWSALDEGAGHLRRYTVALLTQRLASAGFRVAWLRPYQFLLLPALVLARVLGRRSRAARDAQFHPPWLLNVLLRALNRAEAWVSRHARLPWGSSLVVVGCREETTTTAGPERHPE